MMAAQTLAEHNRYYGQPLAVRVMDAIRELSAERTEATYRAIVLRLTRRKHVNLTEEEALLRRVRVVVEQLKRSNDVVVDERIDHVRKAFYHVVSLPNKRTKR